MRIISNFHDFYDIGQKLGYDSTLIMFRKEQPTDQFNKWIKKFNISQFDEINYKFCDRLKISKANNKITSIKQYYIIVVGKVYPLVILNEKEFFYNIDSLDTVLKEYSYNLFNKYNKYRYSLHTKLYNFFNNDFVKKDWTEYCLLNKLPIVSIEYSEFFNEPFIVTSYPNLSKLGFHKIFHPHTLYQELGMFMGNIAAPDLCPVNLSEKDRIVQHGFDKWSFRKMGLNS